MDPSLPHQICLLLCLAPPLLARNSGAQGDSSGVLIFRSLGPNLAAVLRRCIVSTCGVDQWVISPNYSCSGLSISFPIGKVAVGVSIWLKSTFL
jgi:hypothetical protein